MAVTFAKDALKVNNTGSDTLGPVTLDLPEGASQTFKAGSLVVLTSGLVVAAADPATAVFGVAVEDGHNTTGATCQVAPLTDRGITLICNLLEGAGGDHVLVAADLGSEVSMADDAVGPGSEVIWYADTASGTGAEVVSFVGDQVPAGRTDTRAEVGDTNARVQVVINADLLTTNS